MNFNFFGKKDNADAEKTDVTADQKTKAAELTTASQFLIITAATNFGLVVLPDTKKPLMFKMDASDTIASCVERNAPFISAVVDVSSCLVVPLAAQLPNNTYAANKIYGLILPDPGVLINNDLVLVGYEEIDKIPGATTSMLQMLVKQVPKEYFATTTVDPGRKNSPSGAVEQTAQPVAAPIVAAAAVAAMEPAEPVSAPLNPIDQVVPTAVKQTEPVPVVPASPEPVASIEPTVQFVAGPVEAPPAPQNPGQIA